MLQGIILTEVTLPCVTVCSWINLQNWNCSVEGYWNYHFGPTTFFGNNSEGVICCCHCVFLDPGVYSGLSFRWTSFVTIGFCLMIVLAVPRQQKINQGYEKKNGFLSQCRGDKYLLRSSSNIRTKLTYYLEKSTQIFFDNLFFMGTLPRRMRAPRSS